MKKYLIIIPLLFLSYNCYAYEKSDILSSEIKNNVVEIIYKTDNLAKEKVINENTVSLGNNTYKFYSGQNFYFDKEWKETAYATTSLTSYEKLTSFWDLNWLKIKKAWADTFYPNAGDGRVGGSNASWNTIHDSTSETASYTDTSEYVISGNNSGTYVIYRGFIPFDTSTIYDTDTISSGSLFVKVGATVSGTTFNVGLVQTDQSSINQLVDGDFNNCGITDNPDQGSDNYETWDTANTWKEYELNSTGKSWVSTTGNTLLGLRGDTDITDSSPSVYHYATFYPVEQSGTSNDPYLVLTLASSTPPVITDTDFVILELFLSYLAQFSYLCIFLLGIIIGIKII